MAKKRTTKPTLKGIARKQWKQTVLKWIAAGASVTDAAAAANVDRTHVHHTLKKDAAFKERYDNAVEQSVDALESAARLRAVDGVPDVVVHDGSPVFVYVNRKGEIVPDDSKGWKRRKVLMRRTYSDGLLVRLLAGRRPGIFGDKLAVRAEAPVHSEADAIAALDGMIEQIQKSLPPPAAAPASPAPSPKPESK